MGFVLVQRGRSWLRQVFGPLCLRRSPNLAQERLTSCEDLLVSRLKSQPASHRTSTTAARTNSSGLLLEALSKACSWSKTALRTCSTMGLMRVPHNRVADPCARIDFSLDCSCAVESQDPIGASVKAS